MFRAIGADVHRERRARFEQHDAVQLPPRGQRRGEPAAAGARQRVGEAADEAMTMVETGTRFLRGHVPDVLRQVGLERRAAGIRRIVCRF